jgi:hypothetical protein
MVFHAGFMPLRQPVRRVRGRFDRAHGALAAGIGRIWPDPLPANAAVSKADQAQKMVAGRFCPLWLSASGAAPNALAPNEKRRFRF